MCLLEELKKLGAALYPVSHFVGQVPVWQNYQLESSLSRNILCSAAPIMVIPYTGVNATMKCKGMVKYSRSLAILCVIPP